MEIFFRTANSSIPDRSRGSSRGILIHAAQTVEQLAFAFVLWNFLHSLAAASEDGLLISHSVQVLQYSGPLTLEAKHESNCLLQSESPQ